MRFLLLPGQRHDTVGLPPLIEGVEFEAFLADKAFDADWIIKELNQRGAKIVISQRPNRLRPLAIDAEIYKWRHLIPTRAVADSDVIWSGSRASPQNASGR